MEKEIICTLGPSSMNERIINRLEHLGVSLFRINLSHTRLEDLEDIIRFVQGRTSVPLCLDTEGAQIRTGNLLDDKIFLPENSIVRIPGFTVDGDSKKFNLYPKGVINQLKVNDFISIDFNSVLAQVIEKDSDCLIMRILSEGFVGKNKAVTVERDIELDPLTEKDIEALALGAKMGVSHVAFSFASHARDVDKIRAFFPKGVFVISKIESIKGVSNLKEIALTSDALLIDRGDLSRQIPIEQIPKIQKYIISFARRIGIKIYVATNLLESMVERLTPTRAEVNDIFNTIEDGADGLVLAAETAIGSYPINCTLMVSKIIKQFSDSSKAYSLKDVGRKYYFLLPEPHGGVLINRVIENPDINRIRKYKSLEVDETVLLDVEQIALGTFSPLEGFMNKEEVDSVLKTYKLPNGDVWPIPIVLQVNKRESSVFRKGDNVALLLRGTKEIYAVLHLENVYFYDLDKMSKLTFGTGDLQHPGVKLLKQRGDHFLSGKIDLIKRLDSEYKHFEITPRQARVIFENRGWNRVVGFHTRNVVHRVHEHIQMLAFQKYHCDGLFIHPVVGFKKKGDYSAGIILKSYELMVNRYYPQGKVLIGAFQNYSRYAGPREAVFTALCRKNFGCSHFIVGRDHTGVGSYYEADKAHRLFDYLGDIGIVPIFFNNINYCKHCNTYIDKCGHEGKYISNISGTEGRRMLRLGQSPPDWFMREDISRFILNEIKNGNAVFI